MKSKLPIRRIIKLNLWLSVNTILFFWVLTGLNQSIVPMQETTINLLFGLYIMLFISFGNLSIVLLFEKYFTKEWNKTHSYIIFFSSYVYAIAITFSTPGIYMLIFGKAGELTFFLFLMLVFLAILMNTYILVMQHAVVIQDQKYHDDIEISKLRAANFESANLLLKQQIQPHFLFNALNILKSLYKTNTKEGEKYLIYLSDFLRASISSNNMKVIPVKEEVELCKNYITMQKIRFGEALKYTINISEETLNNGYVPSFSIQPLFENAIKHNELTEEEPLQIDVEQMGDWIRITNNVKLKSMSTESTGVGLSNLAERYRLLSGDDMKIEQEDSRFIVSIKILSSKTLKDS